MVGANYMGGKRNTARAKSKDVVGRAQRRHFGKQRLASALCGTQENRVHPSNPTLSSTLPEITLAHARCGTRSHSGAAFSKKVFSRGDRPYPSILASNSTQRSKPSKVLGALDTSDHLSLRAAIDRILRQSNLIGVHTPKQEVIPYTEHMQTPAAVRLPTDVHLHSKDQDAMSDMGPKHVFDPQQSYLQVPRHDSIGHESSPNGRCDPTEGGTPSPPGSPSGIYDATPRDVLDDTGSAEAQLLTGAVPFSRARGDEPEWSNPFLDSIRLLPRSSPSSPSSQSSDNSILNLDTSPWAAIRPGQSNDSYEEDIDCIGSILCQPSRGFPTCEGSTGVDEVKVTVLPFTNLAVEQIEAARMTCCNDGRAFPPIRNNDFRHSSLSDSGCDSIQALVDQQVTKDDRPNSISIDFLSDPRPWEIIDRILKLKPPEHPAVQSAKINFTKDREGVGYASPEKSRSSDAAFEMRINDKPTDNICVASSANHSMLGTEVSAVDNRVAIETPGSPFGSDSTRLLFDTRPRFTTPAEVDSRIHLHPLQEAPSIPIHCIRNEHTRSSTPLATTVETALAEPDIDMTFNGPCLFGDSDLEEDE